MCTWVTAASNKLPSRTDDQPDLKEEKTSAENAQRGEDTIRFLEPIPAILLGLNGKRERRHDGSSSDEMAKVLHESGNSQTATLRAVGRRPHSHP